jgi:hypothetical protein
MTPLFWVLLGLLLVLGFLRFNHVTSERGKEADRIFHNYVTRKRGRHETASKVKHGTH